MRCYTVKANGGTTYVATQGDCRRLKQDLISAGIPKKEIIISEVEVPLAKAELINYLNNLVEESRAAGIDEGKNEG